MTGTTTTPPLTAALQQATEMVRTLSPQQLDDLAAGRGELVFRRAPHAASTRSGTPTRRPRPEVDVSADVAEINRLGTPGEVDDYLHQHDARFTVPVLRQIARALGPTVLTTGRTKAEIRRDIVAGTAGFRTRSAAMSGGAWAK
ncbi:hypothetical protein [Pseudonocardia alaniniphila]|uniref:Uncharacterized protein n=1 Tax=Pseudonocardia alaniniphila TaxID=75291 RepID=A0ABS9T809_9PSEU|nr:hypothetical protein [Pseudonocardia alaniniphila]MCH6164670.1 hypothetical protein [Pseudonocardia alaniniphila]